MKKCVWLLTMAVVMSLGFISCGDDDKDKSENGDTFEGVWSRKCEEIHFKSDGTLEYYGTCYEGYDSKGHYTLKGNKLTIVYDDSDPKSDVDVFTVKERTSEQIILEGEDDEDMVIILTQKNGNPNKLTTSDKGAIINGVKWATRNVDAPGTFAANPEDAGMFYQWNRKTGWPATGTVTGWDGSNPVGDTWEKANDPSPAGWRVPTFGEIEKLLDTSKVSNEWITQNGVKGRKFTDKTTGNSIFLPAAGYRYNGNYLSNVGSEGHYWSSTVALSPYAYELYIDSGYPYCNYYYRYYGQSVRAVAK